MSILFRTATPADADAAVPLIYSSGPAAFDFVFTVPGKLSALQFLRRAFLHGRGELGYRNHIVATLDQRVVAVGAAWCGDSTLAFALAAAQQILGGYGAVAGPGVIARGLRVESIIQPPAKDCWYIAHLGVLPERRGRGLGNALIASLLEQGRARRLPKATLDVAVGNPRAQALYERLGFVVAAERVSTLRNAQATVANHRRMELPLAPRPLSR